MKKLLSLVLIYCSVLSGYARAQDQQDQQDQGVCIVSGYVYTIDKKPAANVKIKISPVSTPEFAASTRVIEVTTDANGFLSFKVARSISVKIEGAIKDYNVPGGLTATIPDADTIDFNALHSTSMVQQNGISVYDETSPLPTRIGTLKFAGQGVTVTTQSTSVALVTIPGGGAGGASAWGEITGTLSEQSDLQSALNSKAALTHSHIISDVTSLQSSLNSKQAALGFTPENIANKGTANGYAPLDSSSRLPLANLTSHSHTEAEITNLLSDLAGKQPVGNYLTALTGDVEASGPGSAGAIIANDAVTFAKMQNINTGRLLGRSTAGSGDIEEISIGDGLSLSGGTLSATGGGGSGDVVANATRTLNRLTRWTDAAAKEIGNSLLSDNGINVLLISGMMQFGGTSPSFAALKNDGGVNTVLSSRLADDSGYAGFAASGGYLKSTRFYTNGFSSYPSGSDSDNPSIIIDSNSRIIAFANNAGGIKFSSNHNAENAIDTGMRRSAAGVMEFNNGTPGIIRDIKLRALVSTGYTFANLPAADNGTFLFCSDCTKSTPCASGGDGAQAKRLNGIWDCN